MARHRHCEVTLTAPRDPAPEGLGMGARHLRCGSGERGVSTQGIPYRPDPARQNHDAMTMVTLVPHFFLAISSPRREYVFPAFRGVSERSEIGGGHSGAGERVWGVAIKLCTGPLKAGEPPINTLAGCCVSRRTSVGYRDRSEAVSGYPDLTPRGGPIYPAFCLGWRTKCSEGESRAA